MAQETIANDIIASILSASGVVYATYHTYKYDRFRCLVPTRKTAFKTGVVWIQLSSWLFFTIWATTMTAVHGGMTLLPGFGYIPKPYELWPARDQRLYHFGTACLVVAWSAYDSVNLEEWIFWWYLMRSVRSKSRSRSARWIGNHPVKLWAVLTACETSLHVLSCYAGHPDVHVQAPRLFLQGGIMGLGTAGLSAILALQFPRFLREVKASGASPDVIGKLYLFHQTNIVRTGLRFLFVVAAVIAGADGLSNGKPINSTPFGADLMRMLAIVSFAISAALSLTLYLPLDHAKDRMLTQDGFGNRRFTQARHQARHRSFLDVDPVNSPASASSSSANDVPFKRDTTNETLMQLMRERGTFHDPEEDEREGIPVSDGFSGGAPTRTSQSYRDICPVHSRDRQRERAPGSDLPKALTNFSSPMDMPRQPTTSFPPEMVIQVKQDVAVQVHTEDDDDDGRTDSWNAKRKQPIFAE